MKTIYEVAKNALPYLPVYLTYYKPVRRLSDFHKTLQCFFIKICFVKHEFLEIAQWRPCVTLKSTETSTYILVKNQGIRRETDSSYRLRRSRKLITKRIPTT
jgi:hypothetical protein